MPTQIELSTQAHTRREQFLEFHGKARVLEMKILYEMWKNEDYQHLGFGSFKDYFEAPKDSGGLEISRSWAVELIKTFEKYVVELGMDEGMLATLSSRKLYFLKDKATAENLDDIISEVKTKSLKHLEMEKKGIDEMTCPHERSESLTHCLDCDAWTNLGIIQ